jgi:hypothetical protein
MFRQRSRVEWLKAGEKNTRYFQNRASHRRRKNTIKSLRGDDGTWFTTDVDMQALARTFYANLYSPKGANNMQAILDNVTPSVSDAMNQKLTCPILDDEIKRALFHMGPTKALAPMAYQHYSISSTGRSSKRRFV